MTKIEVALRIGMIFPSSGQVNGLTVVATNRSEEITTLRSGGLQLDNGQHMVIMPNFMNLAMITKNSEIIRFPVELKPGEEASLFIPFEMIISGLDDSGIKLPQLVIGKFYDGNDNYFSVDDFTITDNQRGR